MCVYVFAACVGFFFPLPVYVIVFMHMFKHPHMRCACVHVYEYLLLLIDRLNPQKHPVSSPSPLANTHITEHAKSFCIPSPPFFYTWVYPHVGAVWFFRLLNNMQLLYYKIKCLGPEEWKKSIV